MRKYLKILLLLPLLSVVCLSQPLYASQGSFASALADSMRRYVGHRETGNNRSILINRWNKEAGVPAGSFWCASFIYAQSSCVAKARNLENPLKKTASVAQQLRYAKTYGTRLMVIKVRYGTQLEKGDLGCIKSGKKYGDRDIGGLWSGHIYAVQEQRENSVKTIEGNTNSGGSRNGDRVAERYRQIKDAVAFIRIRENDDVHTTR